MPRPAPAKRLVALCTSRTCSFTTKPDISFTLKNVPSTARDCPDCGSLLFWKKLTEKMIAIYTKPLARKTEGSAQCR